MARILAELKLLTTDVGRMAMSAAAVNDVAAWIVLALAIALSGTGHYPIIVLWVFLCGFGFVLCCSLIGPRIFRWKAQRCPVGEPVDEMYVCATLAAVLAAGFVTDAIGIHALFGAFVMGILVPKGPFASALVEKVEDLVYGVLGQNDPFIKKYIRYNYFLKLMFKLIFLVLREHHIIKKKYFFNHFS